MERRRYRALDGIRGFALLNMIAYHTIWDLVYIFGVNWSWYRSKGAYIWQQGICWTFIFLSGFCWSIGRHPVRRGVTVFLGGAVISIATIVAMPQNKVVFGVLTLIGSCMLIMTVLDKLLTKANAVAGLIISAVLFAASRNINQGYIGFENFNLYKLPDVLYKNMFTSYIGFTHRGFYSTDYFSLLPWVFLFGAGYFLYKALNRTQVLSLLECGKVPWLEWLGWHSFWIYMIHQPLIYVVLNILPI